MTRYVVEFDWAYSIRQGKEARIARIYEMEKPQGFPPKSQQPLIQLLADSDKELARALLHWFDDPASFFEVSA